MSTDTKRAADTLTLRDVARRVLSVEAAAVRSLADALDESFAAACRLCLDCPGRVVVTGMGKSGHIAGKIAATLASTGTPAFFVHAGEASHGDLGMITRSDAVLAISNSGETAELAAMLPNIRRLGVPLIAITNNPDSTLSRSATVNLNIHVSEEACPLNLAPTTTTTATLALGDALAVALMEARGFTETDFAQSHPGGRLGRRLLLQVGDLMHSNEAAPIVNPQTLLADALLEMTRKRLGLTTVADDDGKLLGVFTDGDLRRALDLHVDVHNTAIGEVMVTDCKSVTPQTLAWDAVELLEQHKITALPVVDERQRVIGALNIHDLFRAGVM